MTTITTGFDHLHTAPAAEVYVADTLTGTYLPVEEADLELRQLSKTAGPTIDQALFTIRYSGRFKRPGRPGFEVVPPQDLLDKFVRVDFAGERWYGVFVDDDRDEHGSFGLGVEQTGQQRVTALGLEFLLTKTVVTSTVVRMSDGTITTLGRGLTFNGDEDGSVYGNMYERDVSPFYVFDGRHRRDGTPWSSFEALDHLLAYHPPTDGSGAALGTWELAGASQDPLGWLRQTVPTDGRTLFDLVENLVDRRRGLSWYVSFDEETGTVTLNPFTQTADEVVLPGVGTIPVNVDQVALDFEGSVDVDPARVRSTALTRYDRIVVRGARKTTTATFPFRRRVEADPHSFVEDWTENEEAAYLAGAGFEPGYDDLDFEQKVKRNTEIRSSESLSRVFRRFRLHPEFPGRLVDDDGSGSQYLVAPPHDDDLNPLAEWHPETNPTGEPLWIDGLRFERELRLVDRAVYSGSRIADGTWLADVSQESSFAPRPPLVFCRTTYPADHPDGEPVRFAPVQLLSDSAANVGSEDAREWSLAVEVLDDAPAIQLEASKPAHFFGRRVFDVTAAAVAEEDEPDSNGGLDWASDTRATLTFEQESHLVHAEVITERAEGEHQRDLLIERPEFRRDYVVPRTVVAIENGELVYSESGGYVRDDLPRARAVAKAAAAWYGTERHALRFGVGQIVKLVSLGQLVTTIGKGATLRTVNAAVTRIVYDFDAVRTDIETSFGELDFS